MFEQVRQARFIEGQNLTVDWRTYGTHVELVSQFASELFKSPVDVIIVGGDPATKAAQKATTTVPILAFTDDMVASGFVSSLAKHGGNTTRISLSCAGARLTAARHTRRGRARTTPPGGSRRHYHHAAPFPGTTR